MRDLFLLAALLAIAPLTLRSPIIGLLAWIWISLMNPQREVYTFLNAFPLNMVVTVLTALAWAASKERKVVPANLFVVAMIAFAGWTCITTLLALDRPTAYVLWERTMKTIILVLAVATLANTKARIQAVIWAVVVSLGYYAVKGGGFVLVTGGRHAVLGPAASQIEDNNALGLALLVLLPLINYLRMSSGVRFTRFGALGAMGLTLVAVIGTYSRGALLGLGAVLVTLAMRSRIGLVMLLAGALLSTSIVSALPPAWINRMSTIQTADSDESFNGRLAAWKTSLAIAEARPLIGGGFSSVKVKQVVDEFQVPGGLKAPRAAHSIYFEVLGDHGFMGFALYALAIAAAWINTMVALSAARGRPDLAWATQLGRMLQVSMVAYLVSGAALSMAYYDGTLIILALTVALVQVVRAPTAEMIATTTGPKWKQPANQNPVDLAA
jgi:probable O-glycosylation ligase (exosortase A-associated)